MLIETYFKPERKWTSSPTASTGVLFEVVNTEHYGKRLQAAMDHAGRSVVDLAVHLDVSLSSLYSLLRGKGAHTAANCVRVARFCDVSAYWLATGMGPMTASPRSPEARAVAQMIDDLPTVTDRRIALARIVTDVLTRAPASLRPEPTESTTTPLPASEIPPG